jgi:hypothetical protein
LRRYILFYLWIAFRSCFGIIFFFSRSRISDLVPVLLPQLPSLQSRTCRPCRSCTPSRLTAVDDNDDQGKGGLRTDGKITRTLPVADLSHATGDPSTQAARAGHHQARRMHCEDSVAGRARKIAVDSGPKAPLSAESSGVATVDDCLRLDERSSCAHLCNPTHRATAAVGHGGWKGGRAGSAIEGWARTDCGGRRP